MTTTLTRDNPWPGAESYRREDAAFFRGRDSEIDQLVQLVRRARAVVLYGASGLGKTSLVNAGVMSRLEPDEYFAVRVRIAYVAGAPPVEEQIRAELLKAMAAVPAAPRMGEGLTVWEYLHPREQASAGPRPLFVFDQFEELFTIGADTPQAAQLVEELKGLVEGTPSTAIRERLEEHPDQARNYSFQRSDHRVLISIREDFLYGLEALRNQVPSIIHNRFQLKALGGARAMEAVTHASAADHGDGAHPPGAVHALVRDDVAELIVRTVASAAVDARPLDTLDVEPALLSIFCSELARRRPPGAPIVRDLVTGSRTAILYDFYERVLRGAPAAVRAFIESELVTPTGFRTSAVLSEALAVPGFTEGVLKHLVDSRLLRVVPRANGKWLELTHDVLTEVASNSRRKREEHEAMVASHRARRKRALAAIAGLLVVLVVFVALYRTERRARDEADKRLDSETHAAREHLQRLHETQDAKRTLRRQFIDANLREGRHREALAQLAASIRDDPGATWAAALLGDLLARRSWPVPLPPLFPEGKFQALDSNRNGTRLAALYDDGHVVIRGDLSLNLEVPPVADMSLRLSTDGQRLTAFPWRGGEVVQWNLAGAPDVTSTTAPADMNDADLSGDGRVVALGSGDTITVWRPETGDRTELKVQLGPPALAVSDDGRWLAYTKRRGEVVVVDSKQRPLLHLPVTPETLTFDWGSTLIASTVGGRVRRWRATDGAELPPLRTARPPKFFSMPTSGKTLAIALDGGGIELWREPWTQPKTLGTSGSAVWQVHFSEDGDWLAASTRTGSIGFWSTATGDRLAEPVHIEGLAHIRTLPDHVVVAGSMGGGSARWRISPVEGPTLFDLKEPLAAAWLATESEPFALGRSSFVDFSAAAVPLEHYHSRIVPSRDRKHCLSLYLDGLYLRGSLPKANDATVESLILEGLVRTAEFSRDSSRFVAVKDRKALVYDAATGKQVGAPIEDVIDAWISDDGTRLAIVGLTKVLRVLKLEGTGAGEVRHRTPLMTYNFVSFGPADRVVLAIENTARVWSLADDSFVGETMTHEGNVNDAQFSRDGRWIVTASADKRARIWDAATGLPASDWFEHDEGVVKAEFSDSARRLLTATSGGKIRVWKLSPLPDGTKEERNLVATLAETLAGTRVDPETNEERNVERPYEQLEQMRSQVEGLCAGARGEGPSCSDTVRFVRGLLGPGGQASTARR